jgi:hypothetical protein
MKKDNQYIDGYMITFQESYWVLRRDINILEKYASIA